MTDINHIEKQKMHEAMMPLRNQQQCMKQWCILATTQNTKHKKTRETIKKNKKFRITSFKKLYNIFKQIHQM